MYFPFTIDTIHKLEIILLQNILLISVSFFSYEIDYQMFESLIIWFLEEHCLHQHIIFRDYNSRLIIRIYHLNRAPIDKQVLNR